MLTNKNVVLAIFVCFFAELNLVFFEGYIATYLVRLGFNQNNVGYVLGAENIFYMPMCLLLPEYLPKEKLSYKL